MKSWNVFDESNGEVFFKPIKTRYCSLDDFNDLDGSKSNSRFYKSESKWTVSALRTYAPQMICIDE